MITIPNMIGAVASFELDVMSSSSEGYVYCSSKHAKYGERALLMTGAADAAERTYVVRQKSVGYVTPALNPTHLYYARVETYQETAAGSTDIYWPIAEPSFLNGQSGPAGQWNTISAVNGRGSFTAGSYQIRLDYNNNGSTAYMWFDGLVLVDLTAAFGAGYEPDKAWCDTHIPFGTGDLSVPEPVPRMPENLRKTGETADTVTLAWESSKFATGYMVYKDGELVATVTGTSCTVPITPFKRTAYTVAAYNDLGASAVTGPLYTTVFYLITDRTEADVARTQELAAKGWDAMTADEQAEWSSNLKGAYNVSDLNRVTAAMEYLTDLLRGYGYNVDYHPVSITHADGTADGTWLETDEPTYSQLERYRLNVAAVRAVLAMLPTTPETPARIVASSVGATDGLTWAGANDIERILLAIDTLITSMLQTRLYAAQPLLYCGFALYMTVEPKPVVELDLYTGELSVTYTHGYNGPTFEINEDGYLCATYPDGYIGPKYTVDPAGYLIAE